jgi:hypothetical protein
MQLVVQGADIDGIVLRADHGGIVAGEVVVEGGGPLPPAASPLRVTTQPAVPTRMSTPSIPPGEDDGLVRSDGGFSRRSMSGPVIVRVSGLPRGWAIKAVDLAGRDHADVPLDVPGGSRLEGVKVMITDRFPSVAGRITDERGNTAEGTVLLFPSDSAKWLETAGTARSTRPDQAGMYRFETVRPGEYLLIALDSIQQWQVYDPEFLEALRSKAKKVTLTESETENVNLTIER